MAKYPEITFKSRRVKQTGAQSGDILGDLTMHGVNETIVPRHANCWAMPRQPALRATHPLCRDDGPAQSSRVRIALQRRR